MKVNQDLDIRPELYKRFKEGRTFRRGKQGIAYRIPPIIN